MKHYGNAVDSGGRIVVVDETEFHFLSHRETIMEALMTICKIGKSFTDIEGLSRLGSAAPATRKPERKRPVPKPRTQKQKRKQKTASKAVRKPQQKKGKGTRTQERLAGAAAYLKASHPHSVLEIFEHLAAKKILPNVTVERVRLGVMLAQHELFEKVGRGVYKLAGSKPALEDGDRLAMIEKRDKELRRK